VIKVSEVAMARTELVGVHNVIMVAVAGLADQGSDLGTFVVTVGQGVRPTFQGHLRITAEGVAHLIVVLIQVVPGHKGLA
jgi:hypothetical protein